jgi:hypothetical protein
MTSKKPSKSKPQANGFPKKDRCIFRYFDGCKMTTGDPLVIQRALLSYADLNLEADLKLMDAKLPQLQSEATTARDRVLAAVRSAFQVQPYADGKGLTELECFELLGTFGKFLTELKKNFTSLPTSLKPTPAVTPAP